MQTTKYNVQDQQTALPIDYKLVLIARVISIREFLRIACHAISASTELRVTFLTSVLCPSMSPRQSEAVSRYAL